MPQIFHRSTNTLAKVTIFGGLFIIVFAAWALAEINRSSWNTGAFVEREQPVQFSHKHHVGDDGIDCRYCHTTVEKLGFAGIPPTKTCMNCHSQIWADSPYLEPVRERWRTGKPIKWTRVHDLPDFAYFNHSTSTVYPRSSILNPPSSILHPRSSIFQPRSSILAPRSSRHRQAILAQPRRVGRDRRVSGTPSSRIPGECDRVE